MAELRNYDIPGAFNAGFDRGRQQRQVNMFNQLASQAYGAAPAQQEGLVQQAIANDAGTGMQLGQALASDEDRRTRNLVNMSRMLTSAPEQARPRLYQQMLPALQRFGVQAPDQYDDTVAQTAQAIVQAYGGGKGVEQFTLSPGSKRFNPDGSVVAEVPFAPANANIVKVPDGQGGTMDMVWDPRTRQLADLPTPAQAPPASGVWVQPGASYQTPAGIVQIEPGMSPDDLAAVQADIEAGGQVNDYRLPDRNVTPQQRGLGYTPPKQPAAPSGYRTNPDGSLSMIPGGPAEVAAQARDDARAARQAAEAAKREQRLQGDQARQAASAEAAYGLVSAIDTLSNHPGFAELGTAAGDLKLATPVIRSDVKDANAQLKNIAGQVALSTMATLKALSSQGATGFGALSAPELKLLENSIATLQSDQISNAQIRQSLQTIREKVSKIANWKPEPAMHGPAPADAPPQPASDIDALLDMYR